MIAFLGAGLMGAAFARAALARGERVHVWSRTPEKARALEGEGAAAFTDAAEAVRGASYIHLALADDASVDGALDRMQRGIGSDAVIIDHTTTTPALTAARCRRMRERGALYVHAPVFMGPKNALDATGVMLISGLNGTYERVRAHLEPMTGRLVYLGGDEGRAAAFKLLGNMMIVFVISGLADVYALARGLGISPIEAHSLFDFFKPAGQIDARGRRMAEGHFEPAFGLSMARKDVRLMLDTAELTGATVEVLPAIAQLMDRAIAEGLGECDLGAVAHRAVR
jgi:3-hydroxyisobutyrate dehydrogenase